MTTHKGTMRGQRVFLDKTHPEVYAASLAVSKAIRTATEQAGLSRVLVELVSIRISQINGCSYCLDVHVRASLKAGEGAQRLALLSAWRDTSLFTATERAALTLAESITTLPDVRTQDADYAEAAQHLTPLQISAVSWVALSMNMFNRLSIVSKHQVRPKVPFVTPTRAAVPSTGSTEATAS